MISLNEYKDIIEQYESLKKEIEGLEFSCKQSNEKIEYIIEEKNTKLSGVTTDRASYIREQIASTIETSTYSVRKDISDVSNQLSNTQDSSFSDDIETIKDYLSDYIDVNNKARKVLKHYIDDNPSLMSDLKEKSIPKSIYNSLEGLTTELEKGLATIDNDKDNNGINDEDENIPLLDMLEDILFKVDIQYRLLFYGVLIGTPLVIAYISPLTFVIPVIITTLVKFLSDINNKKKEYKVLGNLKYYIGLCDRLRVILMKTIENKKKSNSEKFEKDKEEQLNLLTAKLKELQLLKQDIETKITEEIYATSENENYEQEQKAQIEALYLQKVEAEKEGLQEKEALLAENRELLGELGEQRESGRNDILERYFNLKNVGDAKILSDTFLLGLDEYEPVTLKMYNYSAHIVSTTRNQSDVIIGFIKMCLTQFLCCLNPSCINIYIVDVDNDTSRFGIFGALEQNNIAKIITTEDELKELTKSLYEEKCSRDKTVLAKADNITEYNNKMIENCGITLPYIVLISTHHNEELLIDKNYIPLLTAGNMGIVTISMWNKRLFDYRDGDKIESLESKLKVLELSCNVTQESDADIDATTISSLSNDGMIIQLKRQEIEQKIKSLKIQMANLKAKETRK